MSDLRVDCVVPDRQHGLFHTAIFWDWFDVPSPAIESWDYLEPFPHQHNIAPGAGMDGGGALSLISRPGITDPNDWTHGNRKIALGDWPVDREDCPTFLSGEQIRELYVRLYVKHAGDWKAGIPLKLFRMTVMGETKSGGGDAGGYWRQAATVRVRNEGCCYALDPATGILGGELVTRHHNDIQRLSRARALPPGRDRSCMIGEGEYCGPPEWNRWVCVEAHVRLNQPGVNDGLAELFVDGNLCCELNGINLVDTWTERGINLVSIETNKKQIATQQRWVDEFVISRKPIGPVVAPASPTFRVSGCERWQLMILSRITDDKYGFFCEGESETIDVELPAGTYTCCVMRDGEKTWSPVHQPFRVL